MIRNVLLIFLLFIWSNSFSQQVRLSKAGEQRIANKIYLIYNLIVYNNTNKPICVPVSNHFAYRMNVNDTLELGDIYSEKDSLIVVSLFWSKQDLEIDPQQIPSYPVVLNPRTYLLTNIMFTKDTIIKETYFEFKYTFGPELDYQKISSSYYTEPKFVWRRGLKFIDERIKIEL